MVGDDGSQSKVGRFKRSEEEASDVASKQVNGNIHWMGTKRKSKTEWRENSLNSDVSFPQFPECLEGDEDDDAGDRIAVKQARSQRDERRAQNESSLDDFRGTTTGRKLAGDAKRFDVIKDSQMDRSLREDADSELQGECEINSSEGDENGSSPVRSGDSNEEYEEMKDGIGDVHLSKPVKRRRFKKEEAYCLDGDSAEGLWASSLKGPHLDLMVSLKRLAEERLRNTGEDSLARCLTPLSLRTIGIILEEIIKDQLGWDGAHLQKAVARTGRTNAHLS